MKNHTKTMLRTILFLSIAGPLQADTPSFVGVGFLSQENKTSECTGISDENGIVCGVTRGDGDPGETQGFYWTTTHGMVPLGNPELTVGSKSGRAEDIAGNGAVIVGTTKFDGLNSVGFKRQTVDGWEPLGPTVPTSLASTFATNYDGSVSVGETRYGGYAGTTTNREATLWLDDGQIDGIPLGVFPGGTLSTALGVSPEGSVVVGEAPRSTEEGQTAFRWDAVNGFVSLGDLPGGYHFSRANSASNNGERIVGYGTISFGTAGFNVDHRACYWDAAGVHELPNLAGSHGVTEAVDITPDGSVMIGWGRQLTKYVPIVWDDVNGARNIFEIMTQAGVDVSDWNSGWATAVSADGKTVVGYGYRGDPLTREGWVCTLP